MLGTVPYERNSPTKTKSIFCTSPYAFANFDKKKTAPESGHS